MLIHSDCLEALRNLPDNSVDSVVTDPPYGLGFMGKSWDTFDKSQFGRAGNEGENDLKVKKNFNVLPRYNSDGLQDFVFAWASECFRVLKPGGHLLSFAGSRTYHRITCAIEDAGFEIRDQIMWVYGSGFPKSLNIGKAIDKMAGAERKFVGYRPLYHPDSDQYSTKSKAHHKTSGNVKICDGRYEKDKMRAVTAPATPEAQQWDGWGTALKPAHEPICVARKPISEPSIAANVLKWGTGAINIDGCRVETNDIPNYGKGKKSNVGFKTSPQNNDRPVYDGLGRFPANLIHDGSDEVLAGFPETGKSSGGRIGNKGSALNMCGNNYEAGDPGFGDSGSAARFFYCAKASKAERQAGNNHPTVKPIALMRYLVRLVTPPNGTVLDPFLGSGTTAIAAVQEGREWIGIEREAEYCDIAEARIAAAEIAIFIEAVAL